MMNLLNVNNQKYTLQAKENLLKILRWMSRAVILKGHAMPQVVSTEEGMKACLLHIRPNIEEATKKKYQAQVSH